MQSTEPNAGTTHSAGKVCESKKESKGERQAQDQLGLPAEAKLILEVVFQLGLCCRIYFANFHLSR
jgi:hypothetical protein